MAMMVTLAGCSDRVPLFGESEGFDRGTTINFTLETDAPIRELTYVFDERDRGRRSDVVEVGDGRLSGPYDSAGNRISRSGVSQEEDDAGIYCLQGDYEIFHNEELVGLLPAGTCLEDNSTVEIPIP